MALYTEDQFAEVAAKFFTKYHFSEDLRVIHELRTRVEEHIRNGMPLSVSLFQRSWLELVSEGAIENSTTVMKVDETPQRQPLTADEWRRTPASECARRCLTDKWWMDETNRLIREKKI